jgi:hypothetical protein
MNLLLNLPFGEQAFFEVMARYNSDLWPGQLAFYALAIGTVPMLFSRHRLSDRFVSLSLAALWAWMGVVYHIGYFSDINPAAPAFGAAFIVAAGIFAWEGVVRHRLRFRNDALRPPIGLALLAYAMVGYPLLALLFGRSFPVVATLGLPCPTVIFTLGALAFLKRPYPRYVFAIPLAWTLIGSQASFLFGIHEDLGLLVAGAAGAWMLFDHPRHVRHAS